MYNQGNAFMRAGQRGRAIACYRQALAYRPRDPQLRANLQLALGPGVSLHPPRVLLDYVFFWQDWISYPGKMQATAGLASVAFVLGTLALFVPPRRWFRRMGWGVLALTVILAASAATADGGIEPKEIRSGDSRLCIGYLKRQVAGWQTVCPLRSVQSLDWRGVGILEYPCKGAVR